VCTVACPEGGYDYIAVGYSPAIINSYVLFRFSQEVIALNDAKTPGADPQTFSLLADNVGAEFCANDSTNSGSLPDGSPVYNLGTATEVHSNLLGNGSISFVLVDSSNDFRVTISFLAYGLLNSTQMDNLPGPCDLIVSQFQSVTYTIEKPVGTFVQTGLITCFQLRSCSMLANLYGCQTACLAAKNGFGCNSPSSSQSHLPSGVSRSPSGSRLQFLTSVSNSPTNSPTPSTGNGGHPNGQLSPSSGVSCLSSWLSLLFSL